MNRVLDDWGLGNLILNGDFSEGEIGALPAGWEVVAPNPVLEPKFVVAMSPSGKKSLLAEGNGRRECFGIIKRTAPMKANRGYRFRVRLRFEGLEDLNLHAKHGLFALTGSLNAGIFKYWKQPDGSVIGEALFNGQKDDCEAEIRLYFRHTAHGKLWWEEISLQEIEPIPPRLVKVAVAWGGHDMAFWDKWADIAGQQKVDIAVLTEDFPGLDPEPQDGPSFQWMAKKARRWRMHLTGSIMEQRGDLILNSSPLYDREGGLLGIYSKNQLYDLEQDKGVTAGIGMPVFKTDFGVVGITTCYDNWFPEPARLLAYKGAELICLSAAGYYAGLIPSRAGDNCLTYAVSSNSNRAGIWDSGGVRAGDQDWHDRDPSMWTLTSIQDYTVDNENYMLTAVIDLNLKYSPHIAGGNMQSAPGGRRCRQTLIEPLEEEIAREARRWWEEE